MILFVLALKGKEYTTELMIVITIYNSSLNVCLNEPHVLSTVSINFAVVYTNGSFFVHPCSAFQK